MGKGILSFPSWKLSQTSDFSKIDLDQLKGELLLPENYVIEQLQQNGFNKALNYVEAIVLSSDIPEVSDNEPLPRVNRSLDYEDGAFSLKSIDFTVGYTADEIDAGTAFLQVMQLAADHYRQHGKFPESVEVDDAIIEKLEDQYKQRFSMSLPEDLSKSIDINIVSACR
jgi:hypothetical protein